jgi:p-cumate 2,3-dioxygenase beta subunit
MIVTRQQVEDFLYNEADLLDEWKLMEWADLFTEDGTYLIPTTDNLEGDYQSTLYFVADERYRIVQRAKRLLKKEAHVEYPHSRTRHLFSNIRLLETGDDFVRVKCNFVTCRTKREILDAYVGQIYSQLVVRDEKLKIREKKVILDLDGLRPQGKVSIIL